MSRPANALYECIAQPTNTFLEFVFVYRLPLSARAWHCFGTHETYVQNIRLVVPGLAVRVCPKTESRNRN